MLEADPLVGLFFSGHVSTLLFRVAGDSEGGSHVERIEEIAAELERLAGELNDVAMSLISEAIATGAGERPALEKTISQARRTVDKAVHQLRRA